LEAFLNTRKLLTSFLMPLKKHMMKIVKFIKI